MMFVRSRGGMRRLSFALLYPQLYILPLYISVCKVQSGCDGAKLLATFLFCARLYLKLIIACFACPHILPHIVRGIYSTVTLCRGILPSEPRIDKLAKGCYSFWV